MLLKKIQNSPPKDIFKIFERKADNHSTLATSTVQRKYLFNVVVCIYKKTNYKYTYFTLLPHITYRNLDRVSLFVPCTSVFFVIQCHFLVIRIHNCLFVQSHFIWLIQTWMADRGLTTFGTDIGPAPPRFSACRVDRFQFPQSIVHRTRGPPGYVFFCSTEPEAHRLRQVKA